MQADIPEQVLHTLRDMLRYAVTRLNGADVHFGHGFDNAWDEAIYLISHTLHLPQAHLEPLLDARLLNTEKKQILEVINRRVDERVPTFYLTGEAWLLGHCFRADTRSILPRSFIAEILLGETLSPWHKEPVEHILDLCTGSASLAILAALAYPEAQIDAIDLSSEALSLAAENVQDYQLQSRLNLFQGDLFEPVINSDTGNHSSEQKLYDLIMSNPPYVNAGSMSSLPAEYRHEPQLALAGGEDGLALLPHIFSGATLCLKPNGVLLVEIGHNRAALEAKYPQTAFMWMETETGSEHVFLLTKEQIPEDTDISQI